ncbi:MAG: thiolase family protein [Actinomycetales bacterium]
MSGASLERTGAVIVAGLRTPIARAKGAYRTLGAHELLAPVLAALLAETGLDGGEVADVIAGNATGGGGNVARLAALTAGLPLGVPGLTVDRQCGSGLEAVNLACRLIAAGAGEAYLAGGTESISTAPARAHRRADGSLDFYDRAQFAPAELGDPDVGTAAENVAAAFGISRERQDAYALASHRRALESQAAGVFDRELVRGLPLTADDGPRRALSETLLGRFPAAFVPGGTVTAGNSCPYSDGAAAVLVLSRTKARSLGFSHGLVFAESAATGCEPALLGMGAAASTRAVLRRAGLDTGDLGTTIPVLEFNEAFASQVLAVADQLELDPALLNRQGGALALGHPYGASGAVSMVRLLAQSRGTAAEGQAALAMISIAGGMGISSLFRWERC